ncbi:putative F420-dependent oxidoreductase [Actinokineospora baliensis]|uniref:TIGR03619 family F420-dependent LLM class oxidoreductase n=1 Tax=Actinokineospora baliensis TaxID=547056 RepID=UPI00195C5D16|nr:TIGR03619 family F420-dependent LLM class oxidoreductase [Actinokineospora baliensis]MBM7776347.1 putative F420-dependent oxidoreductase [Actinokineospora baliensis]
MELGFALPVSGSWATVDNLVRVATRAEDLGYRSLWTMQRLLSPPDGAWGDAYRSVLDPITTLSYVAARTSRARLGVAVLNMPFSAPALLAKQLGTLDVLSGGRLDAGLGVGWSSEEFAAVGVDIAGRGKRAEEYIPLLRKLWTEEVVEHAGALYEVPASRMDPKPVQAGGPPILLGGAAEPALRRAGRLADGWISSSRADLTTIGASVRLVRDAAAEAGRDPQQLRMICRGVVLARPDQGTRPLTGSVEKIRDDLGGLAEQGITELFIDLNFDPAIGTPDADPAASMAHAESVLADFAPGSP